jgi:hypothetical protein
MRIMLVHSFAVMLAVGATLLVPDADARAASSNGPLPTVEGSTVGSMRRIIIPPDGNPPPAVKANKKASRPANSQVPVRSNAGPAKVPVQSMINGAVRAGARGAVNPLPLP